MMRRTELRTWVISLLLLAMLLPSFGQELLPTSAYSSDSNTQGLWHLDDGGLLSQTSEFTSDADTRALWHFNSSGPTSDSSSNSNDGTLTGAAAVIAGGKYDNSLDLSGNAADYVQVADSASLELGGGDFTIEVWVKPNNINGSQQIINKWDYDNSHRSFQLRLVDGKVEFVISDTGGYSWSDVITTATVVSGQWNHVVAMRQGDTITIFINGSAAGQTVFQGSVHDSDSEIRIGLGYSNHLQPFNGKIDEVRVSSNARYASAFTTDASANNNHGQLALGADIDDNGKFGKAMSFDGNGSHVNIPGGTSTDLSGDWTIEAWIKPNDVSGIRNIFSKWDWYNNKRSYQLRIEDGKLSLHLCVTGSLPYYFLNGVTDIPTNQWTHVVAIRKGNELRLYINGKEDAQDTFTEQIYGSDIDLKIGSSYPESPFYFSGLIDEPRISNVARNGDILTDLVNPVIVIVPQTSQVSPVCAEGINAMAGNTTTVTHPGGTDNLIAIAANAFYKNVPLNADGSATSMTFAFSNQTNDVVKSTTWIATDVSQGGSITIRKGDSLLLTGIGTGTALAIDTDYDSGAGFSADHSGSPGDTFAQEFNTAGIFFIEAEIDGVSIGQLTVTVADINFNGPIACEMNYERLKDVSVSGTNTSDVHFMTGYAVGMQAAFDNGNTINIKPTLSGQNYLVARINGMTGPILGIQDVEEFALSDPSIVVGNVQPDGTVTATHPITISPLPQNITIDMNIHAAGITFSDSTTFKTFTNVDFTLQGLDGVMYYDIIMADTTINSTCHSIIPFQDGVQIGNGL